MRIRVVLTALAACLTLAAITALVLDWSFGKAVILAPVIVMVAGAAGFLIHCGPSSMKYQISIRRGLPLARPVVVISQVSPWARAYLMFSFISSLARSE